jgi:NADP-dependent 3-hydroxy acid dehydrogenase YdfG
VEVAGKTVVITGASSGLGRATALELSRVGARVVLAARRAAALEDVATLCRTAGGEALPRLDVASLFGWLLGHYATLAVQRLARG